MEYDPTRPPMREQANFEKYFDVEMLSMAMEGYANRRDAAVLRKRALLFFVEFSQKERDVFIPYLALSYFDRFSSREALQVYELELNVVCCLFLASKMRNNSFSVHLFLTSMPNLNINKDLILEMEARILNALEWRMCSVTALCFVGYFIQMIPVDMRPSPRIVKEIVIQAAGDIDITQYRPSVIAASGVFIASSVRFPERFHECFDSFSSSSRVNMGDLSKCTELIREICRKKHIFGVKSQAREASSSRSNAFHGPGKETVAESSQTMEEIETRPGNEPVPEITETIEEVIPRRPGKEPLVENEISEVIPDELKSEWTQLMEKTGRGGPGQAPTQEISEITEEPQPQPVSKNENFELKWEIPEITEEPQPQPDSENENFELKWISDDDGSKAMEDFFLTISSVAAERGSEPEDTDKHSTDIGGRGDRQHSTDSDARSYNNTSSLFKCCKLV
ncbi:hypothetical protein LWI28_011214 [Acer negundo]|uniref:Cyclin-like domain-containing protein n=1 Tax=Acer negundo TaxID=4023 RepID=A0AAD5J8Y0_ACENE|nr:hypothetical protein LWI28_011214 [Acer negundo]KAK4850480.1 hypothetical protein QYF36_007116 [Acer negundo]